MKVNDKKKLFSVIDEVTENFENKEIIFTKILTTPGINCDSFVRRVLSICYENSKKVLLVKATSKNKLLLNTSSIREYEYFDELELPYNGSEELVNEYYELKNKYYEAYDLIVYDTTDIFRLLENKSNIGTFFDELVIVLLINKKSIFMKDMQQLSLKLTLSNTNFENFYIFKI
ncbi:hypothetical protein [Enterococcus faecalis]|uniref:hypothetical protein n=1 Tax=Enterococcus faecalis TaxID=1351 RepID=UPI001F5AA3A9|nr:hypothetical protein [Enterococcus faecalis]